MRFLVTWAIVLLFVFSALGQIVAPSDVGFLFAVIVIIGAIVVGFLLTLIVAYAGRLIAFILDWGCGDALRKWKSYGKIHWFIVVLCIWAMLLFQMDLQPVMTMQGAIENTLLVFIVVLGSGFLSAVFTAVIMHAGMHAAKMLDWWFSGALNELMSQLTPRKN